MSDPTGLGERGVALWSHLSTGDPARDALALEAARLADRLDELDSIIQGKGVLNLMQFRLEELDLDDTSRDLTIEVKFQAVLAEARQQQTALATVLGKFDAAPAKSKTAQAQRPSTPAHGDSIPGNKTPLEAARLAAVS